MSNQPVNPCPNCGRENRPGAKFCVACRTQLSSPPAQASLPPAAAPVRQAPSTQPGASVPAPPASPPSPAAAPVPVAIAEYCAQCGGSVDPGHPFCRHCGQPRQASGAASSTPASAQPINTPAPVMPPAVAPPPQSLPAQPVTNNGQPVQGVAGTSSRLVRLPGWLWFLIGMLVGVLLSVAVLLWMPGVVGLQPIEPTPAAAVEEAPDSEELPAEEETSEVEVSE